MFIYQKHIAYVKDLKFLNANSQHQQGRRNTACNGQFMITLALCHPYQMSQKVKRGKMMCIIEKVSLIKRIFYGSFKLCALLNIKLLNSTTQKAGSSVFQINLLSFMPNEPKSEERKMMQQKRESHKKDLLQVSC